MACTISAAKFHIDIKTFLQPTLGASHLERQDRAVRRRHLSLSVSRRPSLGGQTLHMMGWVDRVPRAGKLFIGGLYALYQPNAIKEAGITHVLSVIDFDVFQRKEAAAFLRSKNFKHLNIHIDDEPNENLLQHFKQMTDFIDSGLRSGGSVYVHCAMGKSRSATAVAAYLMRRYGHDRDTALAQLCQGRPVCYPNAGFMEQLAVYEMMLKVEDEDKVKSIYDKWLEERFQGDWSAWERRDPRLRPKI